MGNARRIVAVVILTVLVTACGSDTPEATREAAVRPVKLLTVAESGSGPSRRYPAVIGAANTSELTFQVSGLLQELPVTEAQVVDRGALLARLDSSDFQTRVDSAGPSTTTPSPSISGRNDWPQGTRSPSAPWSSAGHGGIRPGHSSIPLKRRWPIPP